MLGTYEREGPASFGPVHQVRRATPAADAAIHLNHASASLADQSVSDAQRRYIDAECRWGPHRALALIDEELAQLPVELGKLLGVLPEQIALTESASRGWALALSAISKRHRLQVFVSPQEWGGNLCSVLATSRASVTVLKKGQEQSWAATVAEALEKREPDAIPVVSFPLIGCASGERYDLSGVASVVHEAGGWFFVDASQAVGHITVDMSVLDADVLVFPARKWLRGPRGIATLCLSSRALGTFETPALVDVYGAFLPSIDARKSSELTLKLESGAKRFQLYEHNPGLRLGMLAAVRVITQIGIEQIQAHTQLLGAHLHAQLDSFSTVSWLDSPSTGTVSVVFEGVASREIAERLWERGINVGAISHRYAPLSPHGDSSREVLRFSSHITTEAWELDEAINALREIGIR